MFPRQDVCHLWELGGGTLYTNLVETPLVAAKLPHTAVVIVIDLAKSERIWNTLNTLISSVKVSRSDQSGLGIVMRNISGVHHGLTQN